MRRALLIAAALLISAGAWLYWPSAFPVDVNEPDAGELAALTERGEYVFRIAGCRGCHTEKDGTLLAGGRTLETPYGRFHPPNITPDPKTGIGSWRFEDLVRALRYGRSPSGRAYLPAFPYTSYSAMQLDDMRALYAYLRTVPAVERESASVASAWYLRGGIAARAWQRFFYRPAATLADGGDDAASRGRYLATALGHCPECHTPRDRFGVRIEALAYSGTEDGPDGDPVPNITPNREHGIGKWRAGALRDFFATGMKPDGDFASGAMVVVIDNSTQYLTPEDTGALIAWLRSLTAIPQDQVESTQP
jgi:mono/diheme cytochrome c family protein